MDKNDMKSNVDACQQDGFAELSDVLQIDEAKKMMHISGDDDFVQKMGGAAVKIVEKIINNKIIAEVKEGIFDCDVINNLHAKISLPDSAVLKVEKVVYNDIDITNDATIVEKHGKTFVIIPFFSPNQKKIVKIRYVVGKRKSDIGENIKTAAFLVFKSLFEGKDFKSDNLLTLKMLLSDEINYNL